MPTVANLLRYDGTRATYLGRRVRHGGDEDPPRWTRWRCSHGFASAPAASEGQAASGAVGATEDGAQVEDEEGGTLYSRRKTLVEPVIGQINQARGFRRFLRRGLDNIQHEWALICTAHNILKLLTGIRAA